MGQLIRYVERLAPYGDFEKVSEINAIIDNILKSLSIPQGSYIGDPEVGSTIYKYVFELVQEDTIEAIEDEIKRVIESIDNVSLRKIEFEITPDRKALIAKITIDVYPNISKIVSIIITQEYIDLLNVEENY